MRGLTKNSIQLLALLLLIFSVALSSFHFSGVKKKENSQKELSQNQKNKNQKIVSSAESMVAVIPFIEFDLIKDFYLIRKLEFSIQRTIIVNNSELPYTLKYFKALFCFVISPNAP